MNLMPLLDHVEASTDLVQGRDLFRYSMPAAVTSGVALMSDGVGSQPDHEIRGRHRARYQVIVRDADYDAAQARAYELYNLLSIEGRTPLGEMMIEHSLPRHLPLDYRRGDGDLVEFSINFDILFYLP